MRFALKFVICGLATALCGAGAGSTVAGQPASPPDIVETELGPGQYIWHPKRAASGPVEIVVSLSQQLAYVYRSGELIGLAGVSTGKETHPTPEGRFRIVQKKVFHRSNKYDNAPMPHMLRLTWYGLALHGGHNPGYPASHGCIRLPAKFAAALFSAAPLGTTVLITSQAPGTPHEALDLARAYPGPSVPTGSLADESRNPIMLE